MKNYKPSMNISHSLSHREKLALTGKLSRQLSKLLLTECFADCSFSEQSKYVLAIVATACLAHRGISPSWLKGSSANTFFESLVKDQEMIEDTTTFAAHLTRLSLPITTLPKLTNLKAAIETILSSPSWKVLLNDPLLPGWVLGCLNNQPRWQLTQMSPTASPQSTRAKDIQLAQIPALTQWFTPDWIASFLVEQTMGVVSRETNNKSITFFDPACGAGNILVTALKALVIQHLKDGMTPEAALTMILDKQLFGSDIDPSIIEV
ncbi:MAG: hypothetical protein HY711_03665, partial [Candidatus Melainabacteria bacterium]|nr:hypothetical protein [Candidatus Melainabacteria bacterium]